MRQEAALEAILRRWRLLVLAATITLTTFAGCGGDEPASSTAGPSATAAPQPSAEPSATGFDVEAWRRRTIDRFGEEPKYKDGSQLDYVDLARQVCAFEERPEYEEGSLQEYIVETFCPNIQGASSSDN